MILTTSEAMMFLAARINRYSMLAIKSGKKSISYMMLNNAKASLIAISEDPGINVWKIDQMCNIVKL